MDKNEKMIPCSICKTTIEIENIFCSNCGYPERGTDKEKAVYHANKVMKKNKHFDAETKIKSARNTLYIMAGLFLVLSLFYYLNDNDVAVLVTNIIMAGLYLALGYWSIKKPFAALLLGLLLYLTVVIISAIVEPSSLIKGILWKIIIIFYLGKGIYSALGVKNN